MEIIRITENHYGPYQSKNYSLFIWISVEGGTLTQSIDKYDYNLISWETASRRLMERQETGTLFASSMKKIQNCRESQAVHLSNIFNANYRFQAVSGKGVIHKMIGVPGSKMPELFTRLSDSSWEDSYRLQEKYEPSVLFVFIGENNYYYNIKTPSKKKFINGYYSIVRDYILLSDPVPLIVNICGIQYIRGSAIMSRQLSKISAMRLNGYIIQRSLKEQQEVTVRMHWVPQCRGAEAYCRGPLSTSAQNTAKVIKNQPATQQGVLIFKYHLVIYILQQCRK